MHFQAILKISCFLCTISITITIPTAWSVLSTEFSSHHYFVFVLNKEIHRHACKTLYSLQIRKNAEREKPIFWTIFPNGEFAIKKSNIFNIGMAQQKIPQLYLPRDIFVWSCRGGTHSALCINPDRKTLLTSNLAQSYLVMLQKNVEKNNSKLYL